MSNNEAYFNEDGKHDSEKQQVTRMLSVIEKGLRIVRQRDGEIMRI